MGGSTSVVFEGEVLVVGDFLSEAECEVLPVSHLVFVHCTDAFNDLHSTHGNTSETATHQYETVSGCLVFHADMFTTRLMQTAVPSPALRFHT